MTIDDQAAGFLNGDFGFRGRLEAGWQDVLCELEALPVSEFRPWPQSEGYTGGWYVYGFYVEGCPIPETCATCPKTAELLKGVPGIRSAGFSVLLPGCEISSHRGAVADYLRCHLGLLAPEGSAIRVSGQVRPWEPGRTLVFDENQEHAVWNRSSSERVVLLLDFTKPDRLMPADPEIVGNDPKARAVVREYFPEWDRDPPAASAGE